MYNHDWCYGFMGRTDGEDDKAMEELAKLETERGNPEYLPDVTFGKKERTASKEMCDFLILNISSLQIIPVNMIVYE